MLERRATEPELLDDPEADPGLVQRSVRFMASVNRWLGGIRTARRTIARQAQRLGSERPLRVLDIGTGGADIPLALARWGRRRGLSLEIACVESNPTAAELARQNIAAADAAECRVLEEDIFEHQPARPYHCAMGSMFFHHLSNDGILELLGRLRGFVTHTVLISDLWRAWPHYLGALAVTLPLRRDVQHDARLSVRRGFRVRELRRLLGRIDSASVTVGLAWLFRVQAVIHFDAGDTS